MMASYRTCVVCVILCIINTVQSVKIKGSITTNIYKIAADIEVSEYVDGDDYEKASGLSLNQLVDAKTLDNLTLVNFNFLNSLSLKNIMLEQIPVFENITVSTFDMSQNKIKSVPTDAFNGARLRVIHLQKNQIDRMSDRSINVDTRELYLRCNSLSGFSHTWFQDPSRIRTLDLAGNRITHLQHHAFNQMTQLSVLKLGYNHLTTIDTEAFGSGLQYLQLQFNDIEELTPDMFARRDIPVQFLYLHHNLLSFLSEELLLHVQPLTISIDGNPWQCECLKKFEKWTREHNITRRFLHTRRGEPQCVLPINFQTVCVPAVDKEIQQTFAEGQSPLPGYLAEGCGQFSDLGLDLIFG